MTHKEIFLTKLLKDKDFISLFRLWSGFELDKFPIDEAEHYLNNTTNFTMEYGDENYWGIDDMIAYQKYIIFAKLCIMKFVNKLNHSNKCQIVTPDTTYELAEFGDSSYESMVAVEGAVLKFVEITPNSGHNIYSVLITFIPFNTFVAKVVGSRSLLEMPIEIEDVGHQATVKLSELKADTCQKLYDGKLQRN